MQQQNFKSLGHSVPFEVPGSTEEFDKNADKVGACLAEAINNIIYRGSLAVFRDEFLHGRKADAEKNITGIEGVEAKTGIERSTEPVLGKDKKPVVKDGEPVTKYNESEADYYNRVLSTLVEQGKFASEEEALASFQPMAEQAAAGIPFDAKATASKATGPKKLAAKYKLTAARIIANGTIEKANANYLSKIGKTFTASGDVTKMFKGTFEVLDPTTKKPTGKTESVEVSDKDAEALGWLLKEFQDWKSAQEIDAMAA